jgi:hypothetical protein
MNKAASFVLLMLGACSVGDAPNETPNEGNVTVPLEAAVPPKRQRPAAAATASGPVSRFTTNGLDKCKVIEKNEEEGPYYRHRCPGIGGYDFEVVESDLRQSLVFIAPDGTRSDVSLMEVVGSGGFNILGPTFDWRGPAGEPPRTVTVRFNVDDDAEPNSPDKSYLIIIKLAPPSCPVGAVPPMPGQNERAREIADSEALECLPQA